MLNNIFNTALEVLKNFNTESVELLKKYHIEAGQKATGKTLEAFRSEQSIEGYSAISKVFGAEHVGALEYGRKPTASGGNGVVYNQIYEWVKNKGVFDYKDEAERKSLAYAITRKIHQLGTYQYRNQKTYNGFTNPISKAFQQGRLDELKKRLGSGLAPEITSEVLTQFKTK